MLDKLKDQLEKRIIFRQYGISIKVYKQNHGFIQTLGNLFLISQGFNKIWKYFFNVWIHIVLNFIRFLELFV